jgi:hypothetical protein
LGEKLVTEYFTIRERREWEDVQKRAGKLRDHTEDAGCTRAEADAFAAKADELLEAESRRQAEIDKRERPRRQAEDLFRRRCGTVRVWFHYYLHNNNAGREEGLRAIAGIVRNRRSIPQEQIEEFCEYLEAEDSRLDAELEERIARMRADRDHERARIREALDLLRKAPATGRKPRQTRPRPRRKTALRGSVTKAGKEGGG